MTQECYMQGTRPICAIYALLNGVYDYCREDQKRIDRLADKLWRETIKPNFPSRNYLNKEDLKYSLIGEFFDSGSLVKFIKDNNSKAFDKHRDNLMIEQVDKIDTDDRENEKVFYLVPINASPRTNNIHWICYRNGRILNSSDKKLERAALKSWHVIRNLDELNQAYKKMKCFHNEHKCRNFDFKHWEKNYLCKHKNRQFDDSFYDRLSEIKNMKKCYYCFWKIARNNLNKSIGAD